MKALSCDDDRMLERFEIDWIFLPVCLLQDELRKFFLWFLHTEVVKFCPSLCTELLF